MEEAKGPEPGADPAQKHPYEDEVDALYRFRDHYFEDHALAEADVKDQRLRERMDECLKRLDAINVDDDASSVSGRAFGLYQRGRALNVMPDHSSESERLLSRSVKLQPDLVDAWNELGECYFKRGDHSNATACFEGALKQRANKVSLRNLSILARLKREFASNEDKMRNIEQGLVKAKEAVQMDTGDGISWSILGNAYLMHFFTVSQNPRTLKQAMSAYKQAEKDVVARSHSELHYNKGIALKYEDDYEGALSAFAHAVALEPTFRKAREDLKALWQTLLDVRTLIELKGKLKQKRFMALVDSLSSKSLGPYSGGSYTGPNRSSSAAAEGGGGGATVALKEADFAELKEGLNAERVTLGKVICSVHSEDTVPFTFCMADRGGRIVAVNLYNLAPGKGVIIGDSVAIPEPYFSRVRAEREGKTVEFDLIRVDSPLVLVINGKKASRELQAGVELSTFAMSS